MKKQTLHIDLTKTDYNDLIEFLEDFNQEYYEDILNIIESVTFTFKSKYIIDVLNIDYDIPHQYTEFKDNHNGTYDMIFILDKQNPLTKFELN